MQEPVNDHAALLYEAMVRLENDRESALDMRLAAMRDEFTSELDELRSDLVELRSDLVELVDILTHHTEEVQILREALCHK